MNAFQRNEDVHTRTAMEIFDVPASEVTPEQRRQAKTINFGVIYGMGELALSKKLSIGRNEARAFIDRYFARYEGVRGFMESTLEAARQGQAVRTILGRQRHLPDLRSPNRGLRAQAERIAGNTPIQGSAADLLKLAMVRLAEPVVPGARMILTVHDELVFEVPEDLVDAAVPRIREAMETVMSLEVPLLVDVGVGPSWADAH
jgi:DNA polymerase-1